MMEQDMAPIIEWPYNRSNYVINRHKWLEMYIKLCNQEVKQYKKRKKNGRYSKLS